MLYQVIGKKLFYLNIAHYFPNNIKENTAFTLKLQNKGLVKKHFVQKFSKECSCLPFPFLEYFTIYDNKGDGGNKYKVRTYICLSSAGNNREWILKIWIHQFFNLELPNYFSFYSFANLSLIVFRIQHIEWGTLYETTTRVSNRFRKALTHLQYLTKQGFWWRSRKKTQFNIYGK